MISGRKCGYLCTNHARKIMEMLGFIDSIFGVHQGPFSVMKLSYAKSARHSSHVITLQAIRLSK